MTRIIHCRKYGAGQEGLAAPPMPGVAGNAIFEQVSAQAWREWQHLQTMLINEKHLNVREAAARAYLNEQRERFFDNEPHDRPSSYVPPV